MMPTIRHVHVAILWCKILQMKLTTVFRSQICDYRYLLLLWVLLAYIYDRHMHQVKITYVVITCVINQLACDKDKDWYMCIIILPGKNDQVNLIIWIDRWANFYLSVFIYVATQLFKLTKAQNNLMLCLHLTPITQNVKSTNIVFLHWDITVIVTTR